MKVGKAMRIKMEYELCLPDGSVLESSTERGPIEYVHGSGQMLPGLESRLEGMEVGDEREGLVPAAEAYGTPESQPVLQIPRAEFPSGSDIEPGGIFEAQDRAGNPVSFTVVEVGDEQVTVRFTHPLAGKDISFKVKILDISQVE